MLSRFSLLVPWPACLSGGLFALCEVPFRGSVYLSIARLITDCIVSLTYPFHQNGGIGSPSVVSVPGDTGPRTKLSGDPSFIYSHTCFPLRTLSFFPWV
ncbi:hypothetical protein HOY80DRAFT_953026 [Tuber brumale]|nr:hypothetical protein HOY80DRAFT_953026 [Tuber brumale]